MPRLRPRVRIPSSAHGDVAEWLRSGLQNRLPEFDSRRRLKEMIAITGSGEVLPGIKNTDKQLFGSMTDEFYLDQSNRVFNSMPNTRVTNDQGAFAQYLAPDMVDALIADPEKLKLGGEKRIMTIMFCDVRGFTSISEALKDTPEKLTEIINILLTIY